MKKTDTKPSTDVEAQACASRGGQINMRVVDCLLLLSRPQGSRRLSCRYSTLKARHTCETEVKKSKFIAVAWPITNASQVISTSENFFNFTMSTASS